MSFAQRKTDPGDHADDPPDETGVASRMRADDVSQLEELRNMAMCFATWIHDKGAEEMEGLRPTPHARHTGPANQNQPSRSRAALNAGSTQQPRAIRQLPR